MHRDLFSASCLVKMQRYPVRQIGIQETGEAAASLLGMTSGLLRRASIFGDRIALDLLQVRRVP